MIAESPAGNWRQALRRREHLLLLGALLALTAGAWLATLYQARTMDMSMGIVARDPSGDRAMDAMPGMTMAAESSGAWRPSELAVFLGIWAVMMTAMMLPAITPMLLLYRSVSGQRGTGGGALAPTWIFAAGYLLVWTAIGGLAWVLIQLGSDLAGHVPGDDRARWARIALGGTLVVAGAYQFTALKGACLRQCQSPLGFLMTHWRPGPRGALRMGIAHGVYCVGCCWALFAVLVATGVMSIAWMLLLTLIVFVEKIVPLHPRLPQAIGGGFVLLGATVLLTGIASF